MTVASGRRFFFSSRRRHTRSLCDWSSDVCSSDLSPMEKHEETLAAAQALVDHAVGLLGDRVDAGHFPSEPQPPAPGVGDPAERELRSEERRVGKEWRARRSAADTTKKKRAGTEVH